MLIIIFYLLFNENKGGACRQFISEFGLDYKVILIKSETDYEIYSVKELLPLAFESSALDASKIKN